MIPRIYSLHESAITVEIAKVANRQTQARVGALMAMIREKGFPGFSEIVPCGASLTVYFDPLLVRSSVSETSFPSQIVRTWLLECISAIPTHTAPPRPVTHIPVCYDTGMAPDLAAYAHQCQLTIEGLIQYHTAAEYLVMMIGFMPGFPYMEGNDPLLSLPRKEKPALQVAPGSVALADNMTGIYPFRSPGGWHIIGRTPLLLFDKHREPCTILQTGDRVRFDSIDTATFHQLNRHESPDL